jgi:uncharacterized protein (TIGR03083 family)
MLVRVRSDLGIDEYIDAVQGEGERLLDAVGSVDPDAPVPSCDEWVVRDLVRHVGGVHHWAARQLREKRTDEIAGDLVDIVGGWPTDDGLLDWARSQHSSLVQELQAGDPAFPYYTWFRGDTPLTMWARRQAHETAIHRVDADLSAARRSSFAPAFAADGIDELVLDMIGNRRRALPFESAKTLHVLADDIDRAWTLTMSADGFTILGDRRGEPDATLRGSASSLYQALWGRGPADVEVTGTASLLDAWLASVRPAWS